MSKIKQPPDKEKTIVIHPLFIKDANMVMFWLTTNLLILFYLVEHFKDNKLYDFVVNLTRFSMILGFIHGILILGGWLVALSFGKVTYITNKPKEKGEKDANHNQ